MQYDIDMSNYIAEKSKRPSLTDSRLFEKNPVIILSDHKNFYKAFNDVEKLLKNKSKD